jgi:uncharacterized membrane protein
MMDAREQLTAWMRDGVLARENLGTALRIAGVTPAPAQWRTFIERMLVWMGAILVAAAAAYFIAANWHALGRYGKFALVEAALAAAIGVVWWRGLDDVAGRAALFAGAMVTGVLLALVGQVYQTGADTFELFAVWAVCIVPWAVVGRQPALWMLVVALADIAIVMYFRVNVARGLDAFDMVFASRMSVWCVTAANAGALIAWEFATARSHGWWSVRWAPRLLASAVGAALVLLAVQYVVGWWDRPGVEGLVGYVAFVAAMLWAYRVRTIDVFMLAGLVLSAIVVGAVLLAKWVGLASGMLGYLAIGVFIIGCAGAGARWLRALPDDAKEVPA